MNRDEFCDNHWNYYLILESDFLNTERFLSFDLGDNYLYTDDEVTNYANSLSYSVEYVKQYQAICSEIDVVFKTICKMLGDTDAGNITKYKNSVLKDGFWRNIANQKVHLKNIELQPFNNWVAGKESCKIEWWKSYNGVKHERVNNIKKANLKNVVNALAALYILEMYYLREVTKDTKEIDIPDKESAIFSLVDWNSNYISSNGMLLQVLSSREICDK